MVGRRSLGKPRISEERINEMIRLRHQGKSISAIAQATGCHRQTVRVYLRERQSDILAAEVRKQVLTDELRKHLDDVTQFAGSLVDYPTNFRSPFEERDAVAVVQPLFRKDFPKELDPQRAKKKQRQVEAQNKMLFESLQQHTGERGWWQAFKEWEEAWDICKGALEELRGEANEVVRNFINQKPGLKEAVERETGKKDVVGKLAHDVLWVVWWAGTGDNSVEEYDFRIKDGQLVAHTGGDTFYPLELKLGETPVAQDIEKVCKLAFETLYQSFRHKRIPERLHAIEGKIEEITDALHPLKLRAQILRTRCELCPA